MTANPDRKSRIIPIYADDETLLLAAEFQRRKKEGLRYNDKPVSYNSALKLGLKIQLGVEDKDIDKITKSKEEHLKQIRVLQEMVESEDRQIKAIHETNAAALADAERREKTIEQLAIFLKKQWFELTEGQHRILRCRHIVESLPEYELTPEKVAEIIPTNFNPNPTEAGYKMMATLILEAGEGTGEQ